MNSFWKIFLEETSNNPKSQKKENIAYLNKYTKIDMSQKAGYAAYHIGAFGGTRNGKTATMLIIASQIDNAIFLDPKGDGWDTLKWLDERNNWERYQIKGDKGKPIKINVRDVTPEVVNMLFPKKANVGEAKLRRNLKTFFAMSSLNPEKNYNALKRLCYKSKQDTFFEQIDSVLSKKDAGMTIEELILGRKMVDISKYDPDDRGVGLLVGTIFDYRRKHPRLKKNHLIIGVDECHTIAKASDALGIASGYVFSQGGGYGVTGIVSGTNEGDLHKWVKTNLKNVFIFETPNEQDKFSKKYNADIQGEAFKKIVKEQGNKGVCYHYQEGHDTKLIRVDTFFKELIEKSEENGDKSIISDKKHYSIGGKFY